MAAPGLKVADTPEGAPVAAGGTAPGTPEDSARSTAGDFAEETPFEAATAAPFDRPAYLSEALEDAERLLRYVAEAGIDIDDGVRKNILQARSAGSDAQPEETAANLLTALTTLAARVRPVTAESLRAICSETRPTVRAYWLVALALAIVIGPFSVASFVTSAISDALRKDIATANDLALKLRTQFGASSADGHANTPPSSPLNRGDVIGELQQFASTIRAIDARARQLNVFLLRVEADPFAEVRGNPDEVRRTFELALGDSTFAEASEQKIAVYQRVRYFAQSLVDEVSIFYGAITTCLLPVLYALLGTCAYLLRSFEQQMSARTFIPSHANSARFLIAGIGGAVVGLFNNFSITQGASIPPLAIAFLVGYAVDVFFSFLEGLTQAFAKGKVGASSGVPTPSP